MENQNDQNDNGNGSMEQGVVRTFDPKKGYGFIDGQSGESLFVHQTDLNMSGFRSLTEGQTVSFGVKKTPRGLQAVGVTVVE